MEIYKYAPQLQPVLTQTENNTTLWIGHFEDDATNRFAGQTFKCPSDGLLDNIQVYSSAVSEPGEILLTLHEFDNKTKNWGSAISNSRIGLQQHDDAKWIRFELQPVALHKDVVYGFRLQTNKALIGIGEAASDTKDQFEFGHAWIANSENPQGHFFTYFSLTFKIELRA